MQQYELTLVTKPELTDSEVDAIIKVLGLKVNHKASWGKRLLAYEIGAYSEGLYTYVEIELKEGQYKKLNQALNVHEDIIRYLLIKPDNIATK